MKQKLNLRFLMAFAVGMIMSVTAMAQTITVKGHVQDDMGEIIGASVKQEGTTNGTVTNMDGDFTLKVPEGSNIVVSYMGYKPQTLPATSTMTITLEEDSKMLNETVVIGYGTVKKDDMTGSVSAFKPDEMSKGITTSAQDMLQGKIAGVSVVSNGGTPGGGATIRIRGGSSLSASNDPLIVIDGLAIDNNGVQGMSNSLAMVNPEDIETMTVLKDASATAIYGSRASNGVIIITTKKGKKGSKAQVTYNGNIGIETVAKYRDVLSGDDFRTYANKLIKDGVITDASALSKLGTSNTDWQKEIYRTAVTTDHQLSITGSTKTMPYRFSLGYTYQDGIAKTSNFQRLSASLNLNPSFLKDHLTFDVSAKYMYTTNKYADGGAFGAAVNMDPTLPIYADGYATTGGYYQRILDSGTKNISDWSGSVVNKNNTQNPVALLAQKNDRAYANVFIGNIGITYKIHGLEDLSVHASVGGDYSTGTQNTDYSPYSYDNNYYGWTGYSASQKSNIQFNGYLNYHHVWNKIHDFNAMAGLEEQRFWRHLWGEGGGNWLGTVKNPDESTWHDAEVPDEQKHTYRNVLVSYFARVNYTLMDRYLITASFRNDNSSRFAKGKRAGLFPSVALAWKIANEKFMQNQRIFNDLKLRASWGLTGQQDIGNDFYYLPRYTNSNVYGQYPLGSTYYYTMRPEMYNSDLTWEKTATWDVGLDFGILNNRIEAGFDFYYRKTTDLISTVSVASGTGFGNYKTMNIGDLSNTGIEFNITARPVVTKDFTWTVTYNVGWNKNKITKLNGTGGNYFLTGSSISAGLSNQVMVNMEGYPTNSFYVYQQVYDTNGNPIEGEFVDRNGDGQINESDKYVYKKAAADVLMGMTNKFVWKNWDFSFTLRVSLNNYLYNDFLSNKCNGANIYANSAWNNTTSEAVALGFTGKADYYMSDYFVQNASFLKCDNITLGYSFNHLFKSKINGRIYALVQNPFVITKYSGLDPENSSGVDGNVYPRPRTYMLGVNLNF